MFLLTVGLILIILITATIGGFVLVMTSVQAHWQVSRRCSRCDYDLHTHQPGDRCPECGHAIGEFPDGFIERRPQRLMMGLCVLIVALAAWAAFFALLAF